VTVYEVIALLPLAGAVHVTVALPSPGLAETPVGVDGAVGRGGEDVGVTGFECADGAPWPTELVADTVNVYVVPLDRPPTVACVALDTLIAVFASAPTYGVIVYEAIALPPLAGAAHMTVALPSPALAATSVGADGVVLASRVSATTSSAV
jgi:hypothetical protein